MAQQLRHTLLAMYFLWSAVDASCGRALGLGIGHGDTGVDNSEGRLLNAKCHPNVSSSAAGAMRFDLGKASRNTRVATSWIMIPGAERGTWRAGRRRERAGDGRRSKAEEGRARSRGGKVAGRGGATCCAMDSSIWPHLFLLGSLHPAGNSTPPSISAVVTARTATSLEPHLPQARS